MTKQTACPSPTPLSLTPFVSRARRRWSHFDNVLHLCDKADDVIRGLEIH